MRQTSKEEFERRYFDQGHTQMSLEKQLSGGSLINDHVSKKDMKKFHETKRDIERKGMAKQKEDFQNFLLDSVSVRAKDVLDPRQTPMKDLLKVVVSALPKEVKVEAKVTNSVVDIWNTIEAGESEPEEVEDAEVEG